MATSTAVWRVFALLVPAILLLLTAYHGTLEFRSEVSRTTLADQRADLGVVPTEQGPTSGLKRIALHFGLQHHAVDFSSSSDHQSLIERADPPSNYAALVCKGGLLLESIKAAFEGSTPGISFPESELDNGWTKTSEVQEEDVEAVERRWKGTFDELFGAYPPKPDIKPVILVQNKDYDTILDDHVDRPTKAESRGFYYPGQQLAMSVVSYSAAQRILDRNRNEKPLTKAERDGLLPTIAKLSDLIWLAWSTVTSNPERLRYLARDNISNENTKADMRYLFLRDKGQANSVVWPGLSYDGDSDEGKALLATPNGRATAWLLTDHGHQMDWRLKSRQLRVYIFSYAGEYCMLWDLEPQSPHSRSKRNDHMKQHTKSQPQKSTEHHVKRGEKDDFDAAKKQGDIAYDEMQAAFDGVCTKEVRDWDPSAFENGWNRRKDLNALPGKEWLDVLEQVGKAPTTETSFYVDMVHNKDFTNSEGQPVQFIKVFKGFPVYAQKYIPASSAIIIDQIRSPAYLVKARFVSQGQQAPSSKQINDQYVPPLNRWSDATWTLWKEKGGGNDLQYIGHDYIANLQTESVMEYIYDQHGNGPPEFPGLEFGMDSDEGRALLGTANGIGTARLLIDHASELGRRDVRIHIFEPEPGYSCMLFDMRPAQLQSRALGERDGNSTKALGSAKRHKKSKRHNKSRP